MGHYFFRWALTASPWLNKSIMSDSNHTGASSRRFGRILDQQTGSKICRLRRDQLIGLLTGHSWHKNAPAPPLSCEAAPRSFLILWRIWKHSQGLQSSSWSGAWFKVMVFGSLSLYNDSVDCLVTSLRSFLQREDAQDMTCCITHYERRNEWDYFSYESPTAAAGCGDLSANLSQHKFSLHLAEYSVSLIVFDFFMSNIANRRFASTHAIYVRWGGSSVSSLATISTHYQFFSKIFSLATSGHRRPSNWMLSSAVHSHHVGKQNANVLKLFLVQFY